jgi:hypothetical protein
LSKVAHVDGCHGNGVSGGYRGLFEELRLENDVVVEVELRRA